MRLRRKPWARPELAAWQYFIDEPQSQRGDWRKKFARPEQPVYLELGCGKGNFIAQLAPAHPEINYIAIDLKSEVLVLAKRQVEKGFEKVDREIDNFLLMSWDIERLNWIFDPNQEQFSRIYINFCNPWPKERHQKHRLTYFRQLLTYRPFLTEDGEIWFKTDDDALFEDSIGYFGQAEYEITYLTRDLHASGFSENVLTEHEIMFSSKGIPIKFLIARKR